MATTQHIEASAKGESVLIDVLLREADGTTPDPAPASQTVSLVIAATAAGAPLLGPVAAVLADAPTARFRLTLTAASLTAIPEDVTHYYNVWSRVAGADPVLRATGRFRLLPSIELP